jgi:hypothetical protein
MNVELGLSWGKNVVLEVPESAEEKRLYLKKRK